MIIIRYCLNIRIHYLFIYLYLFIIYLNAGFRCDDCELNPAECEREYRAECRRRDVDNAVQLTRLLGDFNLASCIDRDPKSGKIDLTL